MPRKEHVFSVFVGSPEDVQEERERLEEIIRELNVTWSRTLGMRLELVRWETHAYPAIGQDAQSVINEQIPQDYDLFIGIMWCRYGTPTGRAGSGTIEEFEMAVKRFTADKESVKLMFYFKDTPIPPSTLDPEQLAQVSNFKKSLSSEGAFYGTFNSIEDFEKILRLHLSRQAQDWHRVVENQGEQVNPSEHSSSQIGKSEDEVSEADSEDDLGLIDLIEIYLERFEEVNVLTERLGSSTEELGEKLNVRTKELEEAAAQTGGAVDPREAKRLIARAADDINQYVERVEAILLPFKSNLDEGMNAFIRTVAIIVEFEISETDRAQAQDTLVSIVTLREALATTEDHIQAFQATISSLPRITSALNKAKRRLIGILDQLMEQLRSGQALTAEAEQTIKHSMLPSN